MRLKSTKITLHVPLCSSTNEELGKKAFPRCALSCLRSWCSSWKISSRAWQGVSSRSFPCAMTSQMERMKTASALSFFFFPFFPLLFAHRYSLSIFVALVIQPCSCKGSACMWRRHWNSWRKGAELRTAWGVAGAGALQACPLGLPSSMIIFWLKFTCWAKPRYFTELCKGGWGIPGHSLPGQPAGPLQ